MSDYPEYVQKYVDKIKKCDCAEAELYQKYDVKRGLRDERGRGVVTGLTNISDVQGRNDVNGDTFYIPGKLAYRGYQVDEFIENFYKEKRYGFEEATYLLLFGELPNKEELNYFNQLISDMRTLPPSFVRDFILKATNDDMMNVLARSVLTLHSYDDDANDDSIENVLRQSLFLTSVFPLLAVYAYRAHRHYSFEESLYIHRPQADKSIAENILLMLRPSQEYTELEARVLDMCLVLHAEHGGGNNSSFTTHVVTSTGTDTYSAIAAALASLKGPKHGGANIKAMQMMDDIKANVKDHENDGEITDYIKKILAKEAFDKAGLVYGIGHAIYTVSDPRTEVLRAFVEKLSIEKGCYEDYKFYTKVEKIAPDVVTGGRNTVKPVCANVDFYSGFIYRMLDLPIELYTPIFAIARMPGWCAHRIEEMIIGNKLIRPAYVYIGEEKEYVKLEDRE